MQVQIKELKELISDNCKIINDWATVVKQMPNNEIIFLPTEYIWRKVEVIANWDYFVTKDEQSQVIFNEFVKNNE